MHIGTQAKGLRSGERRPQPSSLRRKTCKDADRAKMKAFLTTGTEHSFPLISSGKQVALCFLAPSQNPRIDRQFACSLHQHTGPMVTHKLPFHLSLEWCLCLTLWELPFASEPGSWQMAEVTTGSPGKTSPESVRGLMP